MPITEINAHLKYRNTSGDTTVIYPITRADNIVGTLPITSGGTGASDVAIARANLGAAPAFTYGTDDIEAGSTSEKADGAMHFVYATENGVWDHVKSIFITIDGIWRLVWNAPIVDTIVTYTITTDLTNVTGASSNPINVVEGGTAILTFTASSGYTLPDSVTVTGASYDWNKNTGKLILSNPTGNVSVSVKGAVESTVETTTYTITTKLTNVTGVSSNPKTIIENGSAILAFTANTGYALPDTVTVAGASHYWDKSAGKLILINPTGNITLTISGVKTSDSGDSGGSGESGGSGDSGGSGGSGGSTTYPISTNLTGVTGASSNPTTISENGTATLTFTANAGYTLPDTVTVEGATSSWDKSTGKLTLSNPTGNVTVTVVGVVDGTSETTTYTITTKPHGVTRASSNPTTISKNGTAVLTFTANDGYTLPDTVTVEGATSSWNKSTGKLTLSNPTGNVTVTIVGVKIYYTYVVFDGTTYPCWNRDNPSVAPRVTISSHVDIGYGGKQYILLECEQMSYTTTLYTCTSDSQDLDGFALTDSSYVPSTSFSANSEVILGNTDSTANTDCYVYLTPKLVDVQIYSTTFLMNDGQSYVVSHKNYAPGLRFKVVWDGDAVGIAFDDHITADGGTADITYAGNQACAGIMTSDGDIYSVGMGDSVDYVEGENVTLEFSWAEQAIVDGQELRPLVFVSRNGLDFKVFSRYGAISNIEYGWKWKSGDTGTKKTVYDDSTGEYVDVSWYSDENLCGEDDSNMLSRDGKIFLRGDNASIGFLGVNTRGVGLSFTRPVYAYGDACAIMSSSGVLEEIESRAMFCLFVDSTNLLCPPRLPSPKLYDRAYQGMFYNCSSLKLYSSPTTGYTREWTVPSYGTLELLDGEDSNPLYNAFGGTAGSVTDAVVNTTYYIADGDVVDETQSYSITTNLTGVTANSSNATTISTANHIKNMLVLGFAPNDGYTLPGTDGITVKNADWGWDGEHLHLYNPTGNVTVTIKGIAIYPISTNLTGVTGASSNPTTISENGTATLTFTASSGHTLPDSVIVTGASYEWIKGTGNLILRNPTGNVTVTIEGIAVYTTKIMLTHGDHDAVTTVFEEIAEGHSPSVKMTIYADQLLFEGETTESAYTLPDDSTGIIGLSHLYDQELPDESLEVGSTATISGAEGQDTEIMLYPVYA